MSAQLDDLAASGVFGVRRYKVELGEALRSLGVDVALQPQGPLDFRLLRPALDLRGCTEKATNLRR